MKTDIISGGIFNMDERVKKHYIIISMVICAICLLTIGCSADNSMDVGSDSRFNISKDITIVSREGGSGTRGAFIELFGVEVRMDDGSRRDQTVKDSIIANKTDVMLRNIASDIYAIGYVSIGALNDSIKALPINGVNATEVNVSNGSYTVTRPFNIAFQNNLSDTSQDFVNFILSAEGQGIIGRSYVAVDNRAPAYSSQGVEGNIAIAGSSSVTPIMERLVAAYISLNPNVTINIDMTDSGAGMTAAIEGTCDIGMASRDLRDGEKAVLEWTTIAIDGIAVIVNPINSINGLTTEQVRRIFTGELTNWNNIE